MPLSFPVQADEHFLTVARYVERNALRVKLVRRAEDWRWSRLWRRDQEDARSRRRGSALSPWSDPGSGGARKSPVPAWELEAVRRLFIATSLYATLS